MKGLQEVESFYIPVHRMSEPEAVCTAKMLVAKISLTTEEIVDSCLNKRKGGPDRLLLLDSERDHKTGCISIGINPYATVRVIEKD